MKQLTGLDAGFLSMETSTSYGHVSSLVIYEPPDDPDFRPYEAFQEQVTRRLHLLEPLRRKLATVPLGLDHPYWVNDRDFDIHFHVRHLALPAPGSRDQLETQVARIVGRPLDRSRPLWEAYVIEGLDDGRFAILTKVHHATVDGASGVEMLLMMLDHDPDGDEIPSDDGSWHAEDVPSAADLFRRGLLNFAMTPGRAARVPLRLAQQFAESTRSRGLSNTIEQVRHQLPSELGGLTSTERTQSSPGGRPRVLAPPTPFNKAIGPHRKLSIGSAPLADIKTIKSSLGATVNDVVMAVCAGALRRYLQEHDALPEAPLRAVVPVSIRTGEEAERWTNRVSSLFVDIPTHLDDPLERVQAVHEAMVRGKEQFDLVPAETLLDVANLATPGIFAQVSRLVSSTHLADRATLPVNVVISNVPGPRDPLYMGGAKMVKFYPVSTITEGVGLNITVQSYVDTLDFGLIACRDLMPDLEDLLTYHLEEVGVLLEAAAQLTAS